MSAAGTEQRKLAAIMFTDMVDYSALAQRNEPLALELLEEHRRLLRSLFPRFNGTRSKRSAMLFWLNLAAPWRLLSAPSRFSGRWPSATPTRPPSGRFRSASASTLAT